MTPYNPYPNPFGYLPPNYQANIPQNIPQQYQSNNQIQNQSTQNIGNPLQISCVVVQSEQEARSYPVAPGNNVIFKNETSPFMYSKTMGSSPLDPPVFEKYRLVKEDENETTEKETKVKEEVDLSVYVLKSDLDAYVKKSEVSSLTEQIEKLKREVASLRDRSNQKSGGQQ